MSSSLQFKLREGSLLPAGEAFVPWPQERTGDRKDNRNSLGLASNARTANTDDVWSFTFTGDTARLHTTVLANLGTEVLLADVPSVRRADNGNEKASEFKMPLVIARRRGENLQSRFLAVHEPIYDSRHIRTIRQEDRRLIIESDQGVDVIQFDGDTTGGFRGRFAFTRTVNGKLASAYLVDGESLPGLTPAEALKPAAEGLVLAIDGPNLLLAGQVDVKNVERLFIEVPGQTSFAIPILSSQADGINTRVTLAETPAIAYDREAHRGQLTAYPLTNFDGPLRYRAPRSLILPAKPR